MEKNAKDTKSNYDRINRDLDIQIENVKYYNKELDRIDKNSSQFDKNFQWAFKKVGEIQKDLEVKRQALVRAKKYVDEKDSAADKKVENLKKIMDDMEKRHVKLIETQIKNYDKAIRKFITQEVAKAGKGRR